MRILMAVVGLVVALPGMASSAEIVINNGLAPPNAANVIDDASYAFDAVYVQNVGCDRTIEYPCAAPGAPTELGVIDGAEIYYLEAYETSTLTMGGGTVWGLYVQDSSSLAMSGGLSGSVQARQFSNIALSGGDVGTWVQLFDSSTLTMSGGTVWTWVQALGSSDVQITGGTVGEWLEASGSSVVTMSGGSVGTWVRALDSSALTITGGTVGDRLQALDFSTIVMSGGTVGTTIDADDSATIEIIGRHFKVDWSPVPYGDLTAPTGELSGILASGEHLVNEFHQGGGAFTGTIRLIESARLPALSPWSQLALVTGLMGAGMGVWRKRVV